MPYSIMIRRFGVEEYVLFDPGADTIPDETVCSVDTVDHENRVYYISVAALTLADLPKNYRVSPVYDRIEPKSGYYYAKVTPVGIQFRTEQEGFLLWSNCYKVKDPISGNILPFYESVYKIPENTKVHVTIDGDIGILDEGVVQKEQSNRW